MEYQAIAKYVRGSTRRFRQVAESIKKMDPELAIIYLKSLSKKASLPLGQVIASALANAKQKQVAGSALSFKRVEISQGPAMKRWQAVSRGQAHAYKKKMSHIRVVLTDEKQIKT